jgi:hypothetical protein
MTFNKSLWSCATLVAILTGSAEAQLNYSSGDVLVCFRNTATPVYDLIVDAGPASTFASLPVGNKITIDTSSLSYVGTNNVAWSASAAVDNFGVSENTWLSKPRASLSTQTVPFNTGRPSVMALIAGDIDGNPSLSYDPVNSFPSSDLPVNTATVVVEKEAGHTTANQVTGDCYFFWVESATGVATDPGTFGGNAPLPGGVVEKITAANFTAAGQPVRSDFYQLLSNSGTANNTPGTYLGYFEFSTNGVMTYTSGPSAVVVPAPTITSFTRAGSTNVVMFTTVLGGTYSLIGTNSLTIPVASWPVIGSSISGTGSPMSITNVVTDPLDYYRISAH